MHTSDFFKFRLNDIVYDVNDPRHLARITAIRNSTRADLTWLRSGFKSTDWDVSDLRRVRDGRSAIHGWGDDASYPDHFDL